MWADGEGTDALGHTFRITIDWERNGGEYGLNLERVALTSQHGLI